MPKPLSVQHHNAAILPHTLLTFLNFGDHVNVMARVHSADTHRDYFLGQIAEMPSRGLTPRTAELEAPLFEHLMADKKVAVGELLDRGITITLYKRNQSVYVLIKKPNYQPRLLSHSYTLEWQPHEIFRDVERHSLKMEQSHAF